MSRSARSKYGARPCVVDNIRFASQKEAIRYRELKLLEKAGEITGLELQPQFELCVAGERIPHVRVGYYRADFAYFEILRTDDGKGNQPVRNWVVEDVKGFKTPLYKWKKKHVEAQYGVKIHEP